MTQTISLEQAKAEVIEDFSMYEQWLDKYEYLIDLGHSLQTLSEDKKTQDRLINGCQSRVWLDYKVEDGRIYFSADSDAIITKGIIALLVKVYSGRTLQEVANDNFDFVEKIGLSENLSPTRANGLAAMIETIRTAASR